MVYKIPINKYIMSDKICTINQITYISLMVTSMIRHYLHTDTFEKIHFICKKKYNTLSKSLVKKYTYFLKFEYKCIHYLRPKKRHCQNLTNFSLTF